MGVDDLLGARVSPLAKLDASCRHALTQFGSAHFKVKLINSSVYTVVRTLRGEIAGGNCGGKLSPIPNAFASVFTDSDASHKTWERNSLGCARKQSKNEYRHIYPVDPKTITYYVRMYAGQLKCSLLGPDVVWESVQYKMAIGNQSSICSIADERHNFSSFSPGTTLPYKRCGQLPLKLRDRQLCAVHVHVNPDKM